ncbi:MAG: uracil-DNA glycosylase [Planctomycetes bacterium]|nr:uracil-DNA glycosylase [Planctomycetota bacterium]
MQLPPSWMPIVGDELAKPYFRDLQQFLDRERVDHQVFPPADRVFTALELTPFEAVRVVILGQDPYHDDGQAHGLAFSVLPGVKPPASLRNIFKELHDDVSCSIPKHGCLVPWAKQGVLLLNTVLTVRAHQAHSHRGRGWETFTDALIAALSNRSDPMIFVLWGKPAQAKKPLIDTAKHIVLEAAHPSPLSAHNGFFGSKPFSTINRALQSRGQPPIDWAIPDGIEVS